MSILPEFLGGTPECRYAEVVFGGEIKVEALMFPDQEIRYVVESSCSLAGLPLTYVDWARRDSRLDWQEMQRVGFSGKYRTGAATRDGCHTSQTFKTISGKDLEKLLLFAAFSLDIPKARAIVGACFAEALKYEKLSEMQNCKDYPSVTVSRSKYNQPQKINQSAPAKKQCVYAIGNLEQGVFKIGISLSPQERLKSIQTGYPYPLTILAATNPIKNSHVVERQLHTQLSKYRLSGEWFSIEALNEINWESLGR